LRYFSVPQASGATRGPCTRHEANIFPDMGRRIIYITMTTFKRALRPVNCEAAGRRTVVCSTPPDRFANATKASA
jgi:hypothetical protein